MVTTTPIDALRRRPPFRIGVLLLLLASTAQAQNWRVEPAIRASAVATNNVNLTANDAQQDVILVASPMVRVTGRGPRYEVTGSLAADAIAYAGGTNDPDILPQGSLGLRSQLVDRWLFLDAGLTAQTTASDPFGPVGDGITTLNRSTLARLRVNPRLERELSPQSRLLVSLDQAWTKGYGSDEARLNNNTTVQTQQGLYELRPVPIGARVDLRRQVTTYNSQSNNDVVFASARVSGLWAPVDEVRLTLTAGRDEARFTSNDFSETLYGAGLRWTPTDRTVLDTMVEKRFFGTGWNASLTHRSPYVSVTGSLSRDASTYASRLGTLQAGVDVATMLDSLLTTRIPDATQRSEAVQQLMAQRGLPATLSQSLDLFSGTVQMIQGGSLTVAAMGPRHTLTTRVYVQRVRDIVDENDPVAQISADSDQRGLTVALTRRLTPSLTGEASLSHGTVEGRGVNEGLHTVNRSVRVGLTESLSPRTTINGSLRYQTVSTDTLTSTATSRASAVSLSAGLLHRF